MGIICRTFDHMDEQCLSTIFKSLIRPHIEYVNQIWSPHLKKHITSLENVQRRATKLIPGFKDIEYKERLRKLKLPTLACCRLRGDMIELYKILTEKYDAAVSSHFVTLRVNELDTRGHHLKIFKERCRLNIKKPHLYTDAQSVVGAPSVQSFERKIDKLWQNHPIKLDYTAPPLSLKPSDACAQSELTINARAGIRGSTA